jgi:hypothetical protein
LKWLKLTDPKILVVGVVAPVVVICPKPPVVFPVPKPPNAGFGWVVDDDAPNGDAVAAAVVVPKPPVVVVPNGDPNPPKPVGLACVVAAGVVDPKIEIDVVAAAVVPPKLYAFVAGVVVFVVPKPPKPVGLACAPKRFVPLSFEHYTVLNIY